jgi:hypothetical protein
MNTFNQARIIIQEEFKIDILLIEDLIDKKGLRNYLIRQEWFSRLKCYKYGKEQLEMDMSDKYEISTRQIKRIIARV